MSKHHVSEFGFYGRTMPQDSSGYTYTTAEEWLIAGDVRYVVDEGTAHELAEEVREAIEAATACLGMMGRTAR